MNHDYAHCIDYSPDCPADCFRAILTVCFSFLLLGATFLAITEIVADIKDNIERMIE